MKLSALRVGVVIALATLVPINSGYAKFSSSHSSSSSSSHSESSHSESPKAEAPKATITPRTGSNGFSSSKPDQPTATTPDRGTASPFVAPKSANGFSSSAPPAQPKSANGFSSSTTNAPPAAIQRSAVASQPSAVDRIAQRSASQDAYRRYQQERTVYKAPEVGAPVDRAAAQSSTVWRSYGSRWNNADSYYAARSNAFAQNPSYEHYYREPPRYIDRPSYGGYAAAFLGGMVLDHITEPSYANWAYSHQDDPGYRAWLDDMNTKANDPNNPDSEELRAKIATLDAQVAQLQAQHATKSDALPPGVDPSLVVAPSTALVAVSKPEGHPILWSIAGILLAVALFFAGCVYISARKRRFA